MCAGTGAGTGGYLIIILYFSPGPGLAKMALR